MRSEVKMRSDEPTLWAAIRNFATQRRGQQFSLGEEEPRLVAK